MPSACVKKSQIFRVVVFLLISLIFLWIPTYAFAKAILHIKEPTDKLITLKPVIKITGKTLEIKKLVINGILVDIGENGDFEAFLKLHPGKNFVKVSAIPVEGKKIIKTIRILMLVTFADLEILYGRKKHWARKEIINLVTLEIIEGYPDGNFYPKRWISRGELATWLARTMNLSLRSPKEDVFYDVPKEHWRAPHIKAVVDAEYMKGRSRNLFGVSDAALRSEAIQVIRKTLRIPIPDKVISVFEDVPLSHKAAGDIYAAYLRKLVKGFSLTRKIFKPSGYITRAQAATLFFRVPSVRKKVRVLYNFAKGFDKKALCKISTPPVVIWLEIDPSEIILGEKSWLTISSNVTDRQGLEDLSRVTVDLTKIGGPPDADMFDDGSHGDEREGDGIYTLKVLASPKDTGEKKIEVNAVDRSSLMKKRSAKLLVVMVKK